MSPSDVHAAIDVVRLMAAVITVTLIAAAILFMRDVERHARCPRCDHCRREQELEDKKKADKRHVSYHYMTDRAPSACNDPECRGRKP